MNRFLIPTSTHPKGLCRRFGCNVCGEGGEYETLTLDCPLFTRARIVLEQWTPALHSPGDCASVGVLQPVKFHVEPKGGGPSLPVGVGVTFVPPEYSPPPGAVTGAEASGEGGGSLEGEVAEQLVRIQESSRFVSAFCKGDARQDGRFAAAAFHAALVLVRKGDFLYLNL